MNKILHPYSKLMPEETIREIILSITGNHDPNDSVLPRQSNWNGSTNSIVGCYVPIKGPKTLLKRKRRSIVLDTRRRSLRNVHDIPVKTFQSLATEMKPTRRSSLKMQAGKMIRKVRKSLSIPTKGSQRRFHSTNNQVSFDPFPNYFEIDFISFCLLHLQF